MVGNTSLQGTVTTSQSSEAKVFPSHSSWLCQWHSVRSLYGMNSSFPYTPPFCGPSITPLGQLFICYVFSPLDGMLLEGYVPSSAGILGFGTLWSLQSIYWIPCCGDTQCHSLPSLFRHTIVYFSQVPSTATCFTYTARATGQGSTPTPRLQAEVVRNRYTSSHARLLTALQALQVGLCPEVLVEGRLLTSWLTFGHC
jgi:hypothetical protein